MSEESAEIATAAPEAPTYTAEALQAAFSQAQPVSSQPEPAFEPTFAPAPVGVAPVSDPANPAPTPVVAIASESAPLAGVQPDYAGWLKSQELPDDVAVIKSALETAKQAETFKANQRTAQDVAFEQLMSDPVKAVQFVKLQSTDFAALAPRELLAAKYALDHPELAPNVAAIMARREYDNNYAAAEFEDPDDQTVQDAKVLLDAAIKSAGAAMEAAKTTARESLIAAAKPTRAEGPTPEQAAAETKRANDWVAGVDSIAGATALELEYTIDGQAVKIAFDNQSPAFKAAALEPMQWLADQVKPDGPDGRTDFDRLAVLIASASQTETLVKNAFAAGKASLGAVVPLDKAVNPVPNAPQAPTGELSMADAIRQAVAAQNGRSSQY